MIRIKVIRASHLALGLAIAALVVVAALFLLKWAYTRGEARAEAAVSVAVLAPVRGTESGLSEGDRARLVRAMRARVLIYHTHTHEAYEQSVSDPYVETAAWRTDDTAHSVVRVGESLAELLRARGFEVVHDVTDHELDAFGEAYERSLETLLSYDTHFDLYLDVHRDAYSKGDVFVVESGGARYAPLMILLGTGDNFRDKPDYENNLAFAQKVTNAANESVPGLFKPVRTTGNRYNQHIGAPALLVEVGHNKNTLQEALDALPALADALALALEGGQGALPLAG